VQPSGAVQHPTLVSIRRICALMGAKFANARYPHTNVSHRNLHSSFGSHQVMTEAVSPLLGRRLDARFTLLEKLGSGGQGEVWRAHDDTRGIDIALKVPASAAATNESVLAAFEREHAIAARLEHSSVLKVFPPHRSGDVVVLPMELATGGDLRRLRGAGYLDIIPVLLDIAQALEHAHERGVIHRDLKPGNVLFDARGRVKLADFGAAGMTSTTAADARMQGLSPFTASPEQLRGEAPTESDDIYGLGALAYELLSGYPPYYPHFDIRRAQEEPVPEMVPTRQIPPLLTALVTKMLAKDRRERPRSMREVIDELDAALNDTLAFDFESIVDPSHGAPSVAVLVGPAPMSRPMAPAVAAKPGPEPPAPAPKKPEVEYAVRDGDDFEEEDSEREDEDEEGPDLGLIPDLLVANALVATPSPKGNRATPMRPLSAAASPNSKPPAEAQPRGADAKSAPSQPVRQQQASLATSDAAASHARKTNVSIEQATRTVHNDTMHLPPTAATRGDAAAARASDAQMLQNETMQLPPDPASAPRGVGAAWRASNSQTVHNDTMQLPPSAATRGDAAAARASDAQMLHNDTMQLPPDPAPTMRGVGAVWRASNAQTVHNDTMQLPPEPTPAPRGSAAASRAAYALAANEKAIRSQPASNRAPISAPSAATSPPRGAAQGPSAATQSFARAADSEARARAPSQPSSGGRAAALNSAPQSPQPEMAYDTADELASPNAAAAPNIPVEPIRGAAPRLVANANLRTASNPAAASRLAPAPLLQQASFATAGLAADGGPSFSDERPMWENLKLDSLPRVGRLEPIPRRHWPIVLLGLLAGVAVAVFYWLPRYTTQSLPFDFSAIARATKSLAPSSMTSSSSTDADATGAAANTADSPEAKFEAARATFDRRLAALETRGAGVWGGPEFGLAKNRAAESVGAHDAGNTQMAQERLADASTLLDHVESKAPQALADQIAAGQKALAAGQEQLANQAFDLARRIDPNDKRIAEGQRHTHNLNGVLPLLADGQNAENAQNYMRAAQDYSQALSIDAGNDKARAGLVRANAAFGDDNYAKAVGSGLAALGAGRLDDARDAFAKARSLRPNGAEAADGLRRVNAALSAKGFSSLRQRAAGLEAQERWDEAVEAYDSALQADPSLAFAQEGKDRAAARAELNASMQALIDRPERLSSASVRQQAKALLDTANQQSPSGPVLRSQIARLGLLMPDYDGVVKTGSAQTDLMDQPVRLSLVSDNATAIAIPSIGQFGTFAKRDIQLKPGRYTVIGTRDGFRDVRRDITIAPGQESQTISVSCSDPI
jgi:serine/threonine protein kinase